MSYRASINYVDSKTTSPTQPQCPRDSFSLAVAELQLLTARIRCYVMVNITASSVCLSVGDCGSCAPARGWAVLSSSHARVELSAGTCSGPWRPHTQAGLAAGYDNVSDRRQISHQSPRVSQTDANRRPPTEPLETRIASYVPSPIDLQQFSFFLPHFGAI